MSEEIKNKAVELSDEEAENAAGGTTDKVLMRGSTICKHCQRPYDYVTDNKDKIPKCPYCHQSQYT